MRQSITGGVALLLDTSSLLFSNVLPLGLEDVICETHQLSNEGNNFRAIESRPESLKHILHERRMKRLQCPDADLR